jgi:hypothetical protein
MFHDCSYSLYWIYVITTIVVPRYVITICLFGNLPLQFIYSLSFAIIYVFCAFGPRASTLVFSYGQKYARYILFSLYLLSVGPTPRSYIFSFVPAGESHTLARHFGDHPLQ